DAGAGHDDGDRLAERLRGGDRFERGRVQPAIRVFDDDSDHRDYPSVRLSRSAAARLAAASAGAPSNRRVCLVRAGTYIEVIRCCGGAAGAGATTRISFFLA